MQNHLDQLRIADEEFTALVLGNERLLTRLQAAKFLHVSPRTVDYWTQNFREQRRRKKARQTHGRIKPSSERLSFIKLGNQTFFMLGDLRAFRDARKVRPGS